MMLVCGVCVSYADAATCTKGGEAFAESAAALRAEAIKNASSKTYASSYKVVGEAAPVKVSVSLKAGEQLVIFSDDAVGTSQNSYWVINDAVVTEGSESSDLTQSNTTVMGAVKFRIMNNKMLITCNGEKLKNAIQMPMASSMLINAEQAKKVEFELMLNGPSSSSAVVKVVKVANKAKIEALAENFTEESNLYESFGKADLTLLMYEPNYDVDRMIAVNAINKLKKNQEAFKAELEKADSYKTAYSKCKAYFSLFVKARKILSIEEQISWLKLSAIQEAFDNLKDVKGFDVAANQARLDELATLIGAGFDGIYDLDSCEGRCSALKALDLQKQIILANPAFDFDEILVGRYDMGITSRTGNAGRMGTQPNNWSNQTSAQRSGFDAEMGVFSNLRGEKLEYKTLYKPSWDTSLPDIRLNWDANRILFTMNPEGDHHWQVYEFNIDKGEVEQITFGSDEHLDYFDAAYLPNGKLAVISNVGGQGVPCVHGSDQVGNLCLFDPETKDMRRLTFDQDANWSPVMMHNGKVMYNRWEYTDLMHYYSRFVMSMNPDGTEQKALFGSGMTFPNTNFDIQPLPDHQSRFVAIVSGHHGVCRAGRLFMFDPAVSRNTVDAMIHEFPYKDRELEVVVKDQLVTGVFPQFIKPFPVDNETMLVTGKMDAEGLWGIYLVDIYDNLVLLAEYEGEGLIHATPVRKTVAPPVIPDKTNPASKEATVFIQDIYEGEGLQDVPRGTVKELRIHTYEYAYINSPSNHYAHGIQSGWDIKTQLGTVPVEEDGSVTFKIPANTPIAIMPLDSEGRAIQWMRSWFVGMPGEVVSCVGCHEDQNQIPMPRKSIASTITAHEIKKPEGDIRPFTFDLEVQPILDRTCISCHSEGKKLDFTGYKKDENGYGTSCLNLHPYVHRQGAEAAMKVMVPYEYHASMSPLVQLLKNGHYGVELTDKEWRSLYNWIDYNVPDKGAFLTYENHGYDQYTRRIALNEKYANGISHDWRATTKRYADYLASQPKAESIKPEYTAPKFKEVKLKSQEAVKGTGETKVVEIAPGVEITFVKIPAGTFAMGENRANSNAAPAMKSTVEKSFWMATTELSNEQVRVLIPEHNSRFYDQQWKDHVVEGYPANEDEQVAIRISYNTAMKYCKMLSVKTGLNVTLPTETQWEWAARGGKDGDYWYGEVNTDFGTKENLSDKQMLKMAVMRVDPKPMTPQDDLWGGIHWYDYCTYLPKDESVDDGNMLPAVSGSYDANPFGLYDMLGNVSEWTRSEYVPYGKSYSKGSSDQVVIRGGNWKTPPKDARVTKRVNVYPWQAPYNTGVRLIIEE